MPDSGAVYQPTTVGYMYDSGGEGIGGGGTTFRSGFWRVISRHKLNSRKWLELLLSSAAICFFVAGFTTMLVSLVFVSEDPRENKVEVNGSPTSPSTDIEEHSEDDASNSIACGASMMLLGVLSGCAWAWLRFFRRGKSPRGGMVGSSGQYGPVLTELPSQLKSMKHHQQQQQVDTPHVIPLSDHEEETRTLMQEAATPNHTVNASGPNTIANQLPG
ncbi:uncharacterized protein LOC108628325 isoform X2 [Ceratina calcarata]|uniref:Uncharacterized protein LOC108628325 isoform X2 n=1 Tax=Ceratina calcarata TaxID=156304 RepID=A0AAJ7J6Z9_9HYME|nr:uncharacterized protein LOC108628325 isoform X2 [Ceratina calcarata]